ncbi:hypothetical protein L7F22_053184 [Adiantum nelumboides]|nr:hypothetical protein [Adiantum nelumboides]
MGEEKPDGELYALLHLSPEASDEEIRRAYRQWAQVYHPDKHQTPQVLQYLRLDFEDETGHPDSMPLHGSVEPEYDDEGTALAGGDVPSSDQSLSSSDDEI